MTASSGPVSDPVVAQFFGLFNGVPKAHYDTIVSTAPFEKCNILITAFVHAVEKEGNYVAEFTNWRDGDGKYPAQLGDMDTDRLKLVINTARAKNPEIKILISLGWGTNDAGNAAKTPGAFAQSVAEIVQKYGLDGFDIDYEDTMVQASDMLALVQHLRAALDAVKPTHGAVMTITPAQRSGLNKRILEIFDYTMPQAYMHGGNGTTVEWYEQTLGSFETIVYGLNSEGDIGQSDDPTPYATQAKANGAAGLLAWRLDNDSVDPSTDLPTFRTGIEMWNLMQG